MFYGTGKKSQSLSSSMRQKYTPWSGDAMGGRIFFENDGHKYCLEREFRTSDSTDRITLTDLDSGNAEQVSTDIGERFFGVGAAAFADRQSVLTFSKISFIITSFILAKEER